MNWLISCHGLFFLYLLDLKRSSAMPFSPPLFIGRSRSWQKARSLCNFGKITITLFVGPHVCSNHALCKIWYKLLWYYSHGSCSRWCCYLDAQVAKSQFATYLFENPCYTNKMSHLSDMTALKKWWSAQITCFGAIRLLQIKRISLCQAQKRSAGSIE